MEWITDINIWASFLTLSALEIVLGIDNLVFIALVVEKIPPKLQARVRTIGLLLAMGMRILLLLCLTWMMGMKEPFLTVFDFAFSGKDLMLLAGGLFLLGKSTLELHTMVAGEEDGPKKPVKIMSKVIGMIAQIVAIDFVFSFDSVITAVGMTTNIPVIIAAIVVAILIMLVASGPVGHFIHKHPTLKVLALAFIMMIGALLVAEGMHFHMPRGYVYFSMAFALMIELANHYAVHRHRKH